MDEMVPGEGMGLGDWVWRRRGSGKVVKSSVYQFPWPTQLVCSNGMLACIGGWGNGMRWGKGSWGEDLHCLLEVGSEKRDRPQQVL